MDKKLELVKRIFVSLLLLFLLLIDYLEVPQVSVDFINFGMGLLEFFLLQSLEVFTLLFDHLFIPKG